MKTHYLKMMVVSALCVCASRASHAAEFREYPVGDEVEKNFLKVAAVYFPAVVMDHTSMMQSMSHAPGMPMLDAASEIAKEKFAKPGKELIHLEADIHATKGNPNGFAAGEWIPYLPVHYRLYRAGESKAVMEGMLVPMVANDGPHYGTTLRMLGKGKYKLIYNVGAPELARHSDPVTGVAEYWKPFEVSYEFDYEGIPKK
jgi:uncharacterized protein involved in high-affinity Fe2+ transport